MEHYTSIEESRKLVEARLDTRTADMFWATEINTVVPTPYVTDLGEGEYGVPCVESLPCWSVGALLMSLPNRIALNGAVDNQHEAVLEITKGERMFTVEYVVHGWDNTVLFGQGSIRPISALVGIIETLIEKGHIKQPEKYIIRKENNNVCK